MIRSLLIVLISCSTVFGAAPPNVISALEQELQSLINGPGDVWAYSGASGGGYVFKFEMDVLGDDGEPETFLNFSIRPNTWHVISAADGHLIGEVVFPGFNFMYSRQDDSRFAILRAYKTDGYAQEPFAPFTQYILKQNITRQGVDATTKKVESATDELEYQILLDGKESERIQWANPNLQSATLEQWLLDHTFAWNEVNENDLRQRNGYYVFEQDEGTERVDTETFTVQQALALVKKRMASGLKQTNSPIFEPLPSTNVTNAEKVPNVPQTQANRKKLPSKVLLFALALSVLALVCYLMVTRARRRRG